MASLHLRKVHLVHLGLDTPCMIHPQNCHFTSEHNDQHLDFGAPQFCMFLNTLIHVGLGSNDVMQHRAATWAGRCTTGPTAQSSCVPSPSSLSRSWDASSHSHIQLQQLYLVQGLPRSKVSKKSVRNGLLWWSIWMMWRSPFSQLGCIPEWEFHVRSHSPSMTLPLWTALMYKAPSFGSWW